MKRQAKSLRAQLDALESIAGLKALDESGAQRRNGGRRHPKLGNGSGGIMVRKGSGAIAARLGGSGAVAVYRGSGAIAQPIGPAS
jgi:hypothetical protein